MKTMKQEKYLANHLLPASSNLLGICFLVFSFIKISGQASSTILDELIVIPIIIFFAASFLSYLTIRSENKNYEGMADKLFITGLGLLALISVAFIFENIAF